MHPFDSQKLLSFVTVARTRSFTQTGKELFLSQSAVSHAVKALEDELGHSLLDRDGKKLQVTPAGEHFLHYAEKILTEMSAARLSLNQRARWGISRLRVGVNDVFDARFITDILRVFIKEFPDCLVIVKAGDTRECLDWLDQNVVDVAFVIAPQRDDAAELTPLFTDEVMWIVPPGHPWAQTRSVVAEEIASQNFICNSSTSHTSSLLKKHFERDGIRLKFNMELGNTESVKQMVKAGAGITALAEWNVRDELDENSLVALPLGKRKLKRNWCLLRSPSRKPNMAELKFAKLSMEAAKALTSLASAASMVVNLLWQAGFFDFDTFPVQV